MSDSATMLQYLVYGKIIIDNIRLVNGEMAEGIIGGGGPQGAFGARLWNPSVGLLSRTGTDFEEEFVRALEAIDVDLAGWVRYPDIPTLRNQLMAYDENGYLTTLKGDPGSVYLRQQYWNLLLAQELSLPPTYQQPRVIHLISEYPHEPMMATALELRAQGAIFSLEPIIDFRDWTNREAMLELLPQVDVATPDWPSASGFAGSDDPKEVVRYWSTLGPKMVAIRHGHHGSYVWDSQSDQMWQVPPVPVEVVDPTGAGNSYGGGLLVGWAERQDGREAGCYGAVSASFLVERVGLPEMTEALQAEAHARLERALAATRPL